VAYWSTFANNKNKLKLTQKVNDNKRNMWSTIDSDSGEKVLKGTEGDSRGCCRDFSKVIGECSSQKTKAKAKAKPFQRDNQLISQAV